MLETAVALYNLGGDEADPVESVTCKEAEKVESITFKDASLKEKFLQNHISKKPEILEDDLFIIATEFSDWEDSKRRIDLLGLDGEGKLVVVELKKTEDGGHAELQAIRYAAMVANMTQDRIVKAHSSFLKKNEDEAKVSVDGHLERIKKDDVDTARPRIIIASSGFSKELTTSVLWLSSFELEIKCVRLNLYKIGEETLLDATQIIPLPEAAAYLVQQRKREEEERKEKRERAENFKFSMAGVLQGATLVFTEDESKTCIAGPPHTAKVEYEGDPNRSLSGLAQQFTGKSSLQGPKYWMYKDKTLDELRKEREREREESHEA